MSAPRILILSSSHLCRNPRVVKEATALGATGYDVTVMSVSSEPSGETRDRRLLQGLPFKRITLDYTSRAATRRLAGLWQRGATRTARWLCRRWHWETAQSLGPARALLQRARWVPAELTIAHTEIPTWAAQQLIRAGRKVAIDMEDWYSEDLLPADRLHRPVALLRRAEAFALNHCVYSSATSRAMADALVAAYGCPAPVVLRNSFPLQPRSRIDAATKSGPARFIWFSQTVGPGRGLEAFLVAWAQTKERSVVSLLGECRTGYDDQLRDVLPAARRPDLHFLPPVSPEELPAKLAEFDVGLALESRLPLSRNVTITNKILQYLNAGLAIVATETAGQAEVMQAAPGSGLMLAVQNPTSAARQLDDLLSNPERLRQCQQAARAAAVAEFSWEREAPRLLASVAQSLAHPIGPTP